MTLALIDYGAGNLHSVHNALKAAGAADVCVTADPDIVAHGLCLTQRRLHKAFLRYHDAENWPVLREALKAMGRADLIGPGKHQLVPTWQPAGTGKTGGEGRRTGSKHRTQKFLTKGVPVPRR